MKSVETQSGVEKASISGIVNQYAAVKEVSKEALKLATDKHPFKPGDRVVVVQMNGAQIDLSDTANFGVINLYKCAGIYEWATLATVQGDQLNFQSPLRRTYDTTVGSVQLVRVSTHAGDVDITGTLTASAWDGSVGGVLVVDVMGTLNLLADVDVSGKGFAGGSVSPDADGAVTKAFHVPERSGLGGLKGKGIGAAILVERGAGRGAPANGGGGGNCPNGGGGGGASAASGGRGAFAWGSTDVETCGLPGRALETEGRAFLGGGGGGGQQNNAVGTGGGQGGGIVILRASCVTGAAGRGVRANGANAAAAANDGGGGGGGGGTIMLLTNSIEGAFRLEANGGNGADATGGHGSGGGGSGGFVRSFVALPGTVTASVAGGKNGTAGGDARGAMPGEPGRVTLDKVMGGGPDLPPKKNATEGAGSPASPPLSPPPPARQNDAARGTPGPLLATLDTSVVLAAAVERLNRQSVIALLEQVIAELDVHCKTADGKIASEVNKLREELKTSLDSLRKTTDVHQSKLDELTNTLLAQKNALSKLQAGLEADIAKAVSGRLDVLVPDVLGAAKAGLEPVVKSAVQAALGALDTKAAQAKLAELGEQLKLVEAAAKKLDDGELAQVKETLEKVLKGMDLAKVLGETRVTVGDRSLPLTEFLRLLSDRPVVKEVYLAYDATDITGATFVLSDGTRAAFTAYRLLSGSLAGGSEYVFQTRNLAGLPAEFTLRFEHRAKTFVYCGKTAQLTQYDAVYQSNVVYSLAKP